ncbi:hypothetical protein L484_005065 [Morus notabilis]|uniref:C-JID domain-containing protein n=1 Tax=Morus notabilis TaxID=981085 RepID=W9RT61_9ROSA|nr:hypothetical protein L484_005065 [Morus notabilis]
MTNCTRLDTLPTSICKLKRLAILDLFHCSEFKSFPEILEPLEYFSRLNLNGTRIKDLPESVVGCATPQNIAQHSCWKPSKFNKERNVVTSELQPSFLRAATEYFRSRHEELGKSKYPTISFCLEGNSIPKWFNHQSKRSSIELQFSPDWHDTNILGFSVCVAVDVCRPFVVQLNVGCAYHFTTNHEDSTVRKHNWDVSLRQTTFEQIWIFVWYLYKD